MFVTKKSVPRRTFLRTTGSVLALPMLDAMIPAFARAADTPVAKRMGFYYVPSGVSRPYWDVKDGEKGFELSPILKSLTPFRDQTVVISGLGNNAALIVDKGGGAHTLCGSVWLNSVCPKKTEGADVQAGVTADQLAAQVLGRDTQLSSLELALEANYLVGNCDTGYACTYKNTFSWRTPTQPMPMETNPRVVFERMFGDGGTKEQRLDQIRADRSILDAVTGQMKGLMNRVSGQDRATLSEYLDTIREVEGRIQKAEKKSDETALPSLEKPRGIPDTYDDHAKLMFDLQFLAFQTDLTRVISFQLGREQSGQAYPWIGVSEALHNISHHGNDPIKYAQFAKINTYHMELFAGLVEKLRKTPDGDGTLLDHSMLLFGSGMGNGDLHSPLDLPNVLVGGGAGTIKGNRHLKYTIGTPMANLLVTMLHKAGVPVDRLGESNGELADL